MSDGPAGDGGDPGEPEREEPAAEPAWTRLIAPLRSEAAAFRTVVWAAGAALVLIAIVLVARLVS